MAMPEGLPIIDTMIGFPVADRAFRDHPDRFVARSHAARVLGLDPLREPETGR